MTGSPQVYAHDLHHLLATARGAHPRPAAAGDAVLVPVPVRVALYRPGQSEPFAFVEARDVALHPWSRGPDGVEQPAELVLAAEFGDPPAKVAGVKTDGSGV